MSAPGPRPIVWPITTSLVDYGHPVAAGPGPKEPLPRSPGRLGPRSDAAGNVISTQFGGGWRAEKRDLVPPLPKIRVQCTLVARNRTTQIRRAFAPYLLVILQANLLVVAILHQHGETIALRQGLCVSGHEVQPSPDSKGNLLCTVCQIVHNGAVQPASAAQILPPIDFASSAPAHGAQPLPRGVAGLKLWPGASPALRLPSMLVRPTPQFFKSCGVSGHFSNTFSVGD